MIMNATKSLFLAGLLGSAITATVPAIAEESTAAPVAPAVPASPHSFSANVGLFSQYVFRGITYTDSRPAIQGGFDYAHSSGPYLGLWATNINSDFMNGNNLETDIYGGYAHNITDDLSFNLGFLQFLYPDHKKFAGENINTLEVNVALTYKWVTLKYSRAVTDWFGINNNSMGLGQGDSKGADYREINFNYKLPIKDINLTAHVGRQTVKNYDVFDYTDWQVGLNKDFAIGSSTGWNTGFNYTKTNAKDAGYTFNGDNMGDDHLVLFIKRTF
jgi:uncharacterized protein (TIGR02001 family)